MSPGATRDWINRRLFAAGEILAPHLSQEFVRRSGSLAARVAVGLDPAGLQTYRANLHGLLGHPPDDLLIRRGVESWIRNYVEVLALGSWSAEQVNDRVTVIGEQRLHTEFAERGAVIALPHSGNWDLAGAWACLNGLPVTTVAEHLGEAEFAAYTRIRAHLGMEVIAHDDPSAARRLVRAAADRRFVCLISERVFDGRGLPVDFAGQRIGMPAGPAMVARSSGAALFAGVCHYTPTGMVVALSDPIEHRSGRDGLIAMTQDIADHFVDRLRRHPQDWHMMQPLLRADG